MSTQTKKEQEEVKAGEAAGDEQQQGAAAPVDETKKKRRRGINNETRAASRLKFDERRDANRANGLFVGHLDNVEVT